MAAPEKTLKFRSSRTDEFTSLFDSLSKSVKETGDKAFKLWRDDPSHNSLELHKLGGRHEGKWAVTINWSYRAVYRIDEKEGVKTYWWLWVGTHEAYNKLFKK